MNDTISIAQNVYFTFLTKHRMELHNHRPFVFLSILFSLIVRLSANRNQTLYS